MTHFKKPVERPFTKEERSTTTLLFGGFTFQHERLIHAAFDGLGYKPEIIPTANVSAFQLGKEYGNNGQCNPTYFTVGNLVQYLQGLEAKGMSREYIIKNYIFFTAGGCGPCRFGMYEAEYRLALRNANFDGFRVIIFNQAGGLEQGQISDGLDFNLNFSLGIVTGITVGDLLNQLAHSVRPYEIKPGETDRVLQEAVEIFANAVRKNTSSFASRALPKGYTTSLRIKVLFGNLLNSEFRNTLNQVRDMFDNIECDFTRVKPIVKITGEFWAQTTEGDGNFHMFRFLHQEGAEVKIEAIATWLTYLLWVEHRRSGDRSGLKKSKKLEKESWQQKIRNTLRSLNTRTKIKLGETLLNFQYNRFREALGGTLPSLIPQNILAKIAHEHLTKRSSGGEGHLEVAKNIYYSQKNLCHMVLSLKPFGCMPSTQSDGVQTKLQSIMKNSIYLPIETSGEGEINAHSRVQMALADAKIKAREEMDQVLKKHNLTLLDVQNYVYKHPELRRGLLRLPYGNGIAGKAARFVNVVAKQMQKKGTHSHGANKVLSWR